MTLKDFYKNQTNNLNGKEKPRRRSGVLCPLLDHQQNGSSHHVIAKSKEDEAIIYQTLASNEFLRNVLEGASLEDLIDLMYLKNLETGETLLEQGKINSKLFVSKNGTFEIIENNKREELTETVRVFGEVAVLHDAKAAQTVRAVGKASVWILDCASYKNLVATLQTQKRSDLVDHLKDVPSLKKASELRLFSLCDLFREKTYTGRSLIIKEGQAVENFLMVTSGSATILSRERNRGLDKLTRGCFFGENVFSKEITSQYTILADPPGVECMLLSRKEFLDHFGGLEEFLLGFDEEAMNVKSYDKVELKYLKKIRTLGVGGFGRVELVQDTKHKDDIYALKLMKKYEISGAAQIEQVYNEKKLQMACSSNFIVQLYKTFRDSKYIYFLLEPCLGGDLWNLLRRQRRKCFGTDEAKFYAGCILEALSYLHSKDIVYRDLKPENVMVASSGYLKLTDFGFAKRIRPNESSYSFVGTAEYIAPEFIRKTPHNKGVDYWALGIFIFELLVGNSPFRNDEHNDLKTYQAILKGIDFVTFPFIVSPRARNLIKKLCRPSSVDRIGCQKNGAEDIRTHPWFSKLDWDKLRKQELDPPIRISLNGKTDTRYFESFSEEREEVVDDFSPWDKDF